MIGQDIVSVIAQQVTEQLEEVEGTGILTAGDRKTVDDFLFSLFTDYTHCKTAKTGYGLRYFYYDWKGNKINEPSQGQLARDDFFCDIIRLRLETIKKTRSIKKELVTEYSVEMCLQRCRNGHGYIFFAPSTIHQTAYVGSEPVSREWVVNAFNELFDVMRKLKKCGVCNEYKHNAICVKDGVGICSECYMHARVKRAREN